MTVSGNFAFFRPGFGSGAPFLVPARISRIRHFRHLFGPGTGLAPKVEKVASRPISWPGPDSELFDRNRGLAPFGDFGPIPGFQGRQGRFLDRPSLARCSAQIGSSRQVRSFWRGWSDLGDPGIPRIGQFRQIWVRGSPGCPFGTQSRPRLGLGIPGSDAGSHPRPEVSQVWQVWRFWRSGLPTLAALGSVVDFQDLPAWGFGESRLANIGRISDRREQARQPTIRYLKCWACLNLRSSDVTTNYSVISDYELWSNLISQI